MNKLLMNMIDRLQKFTDLYDIEYHEHTFQGLKLSKYEEYPWENETESEAYFKRLLHDKSDVNMRLFIQMQKKESLESIHINLSRKFVASFLAIIFLAIALIMIVIGFAILAIINSAFCLIMILLSIYFNWKSDRQYRDILLTPILIEMIFTME
jgi:hypothetical protein